jgi:hypothetical protein
MAIWSEHIKWDPNIRYVGNTSLNLNQLDIAQAGLTVYLNNIHKTGNYTIIIFYRRSVRGIVHA